MRGLLQQLAGLFLGGGGRPTLAAELDADSDVVMSDAVSSTMRTLYRARLNCDSFWREIQQPKSSASPKSSNKSC